MEFPKCFRCIALWALMAPPLIGYVVWRRYRENKTFADTIKGTADGLRRLKEWGERYERERQGGHEASGEATAPREPYVRIDARTGREVEKVFHPQHLPNNSRGGSA